MKKKSIMIFCMMVICLTIFPGMVFAQDEAQRDTLYQVCTINALLDGVYDGQVSCGELKAKGDFGIGTFQSLDGEMIFLDGRFYQIKADGKAYVVDDKVKTPFAAVTPFEIDREIFINSPMSLNELYKFIDENIPTKNISYAIKIEGDFKYVKTRSVPAQKKPYLPLVEVTKNQPTFEFKNVQGTIVGFRLPAFVDKINVPGYHMHFINAERTGGGHLLEIEVAKARVEIDYTNNLFLDLPENSDFYATDLSKDKKQELEKAEK